MGIKTVAFGVYIHVCFNYGVSILQVYCLGSFVILPLVMLIGLVFILETSKILHKIVSNSSITLHYLDRVDKFIIITLN